MANTFVTCKNIARLALPILCDNLVMPALVYNDYSETFADVGDTIQVKRPPIYDAKDFKAGDTVTIQDINNAAVDVKLDKIATVDVKLSAIEAALNWGEQKAIDEFIKPAAVAIAEKINKAGVGMYSQIPNIIGTAGTTPSTLAAFGAARKALNKNKAPLSDRYAVWDVEADAKFLEIDSLVEADKAGATTALREGFIGRVFGMENYMTQSIEAHVNGGAGTILIDGAVTKGVTKIHLDGLTAAMKVGDSFKIANDTTIYTVSAAGALETADQDIEIVPALAKNAADNAAVTLETAGTNNLAFHKNAIAFVTRPLAAAPGAESYSTSNGLYSLRVTKAYDITKKETVLSMDVLYGYKVVYPELAVRYLG